MNRLLRWQAAGCCQGVDAIDCQLVGRDIVPQIAGYRNAVQQVSKHVDELLLRPGHLFISMQGRPEFSAMAPAVKGDESVSSQHRLETLPGFAPLSRSAVRWLRWPATWRSCQARRIASTSGKYLYSVARPMPVSSAICDIVSDRSPWSVTSAHVVSRIASRTSRAAGKRFSVTDSSATSLAESYTEWCDQIFSSLADYAASAYSHHVHLQSFASQILDGDDGYGHDGRNVVNACLGVLRAFGWVHDWDTNITFKVKQIDALRSARARWDAFARIELNDRQRYLLGVVVRNSITPGEKSMGAEYVRIDTILDDLDLTSLIPGLGRVW